MPCQCGPILAFICHARDQEEVERTIKLYLTTPHQTAGPIPYDVCLPESGLDWERVGPLFERYSIKLLGTIDEDWADSSQRAAADPPSLSRFRLDAATSSVSFTCRSTDGPVEVMGVLKILEKLLERVNRETCMAAVRGETKPGPRPVQSQRAAPSPAAADPRFAARRK